MPQSSVHVVLCPTHTRSWLCHWILVYFATRENTGKKHCPYVFGRKIIIIIIIIFTLGSIWSRGISKIRSITKKTTKLAGMTCHLIIILLLFFITPTKAAHRYNEHGQLNTKHQYRSKIYKSIFKTPKSMAHVVNLSCWVLPLTT